MQLKKLAMVAATASLATAPVVAAERSAAPISGEQELEGGSGLLIGILAAAAVIAGIIIIADDDDPTSP